MTASDESRSLLEGDSQVGNTGPLSLSFAEI